MSLVLNIVQETFDYKNGNSFPFYNKNNFFRLKFKSLSLKTLVNIIFIKNHSSNHFKKEKSAHLSFIQFFSRGIVCYNLKCKQFFVHARVKSALRRSISMMKTKKCSTIQLHEV